MPTLSRRAAAGAVAALVALATVLIARQGVHISARILFDEQLSVNGARFLEAHFPSGLWTTNVVFPRGPERLAAILLAGVDAVVPAAREPFWGRAAMALLFALAAVPAYALARGLRVGRWGALAAAAIAVLNPWMAYGTTLLNTTAAYTTTAFAAWAMWRTIVRPSVRADAVAVVAIALMPLARVSHAGLAVALPVALLVTTWRDLRIERAGLLALPGRVWRDHALLVVAAAAGAVGLAVVGLERFTGEYAATAGFPADHLADQARAVTAQLGTGLLVLFVVGLGWLAWAAIRAPDREAGTFGVLALVLVAALLYVNKSGGLEERYIAPLAPLFAVGAVAAIARREVRLVPTVVAAALFVAQMTTGGYLTVAPGDLFPRFTAPAQFAFSRVAVERVTSWVSFDAGVITTLWALAIAAVAVLLAVVRGRGRVLLGGAVVAASVVVCAIGGLYAAQKLRTGPGTGGATAHQLTFVERTAGGADVSGLSYDPGNFPQAPLGLDLLRMYNRSLVNSVGLDGRPSWRCCAAGAPPAAMMVDPERGDVAVQGGMAGWLLVPVQFAPAGLAGEQRAVLGSADPGFRLWELRRPLRAAFAVRGTADGWAAPGSRVAVRVFGAAAAPGEERCLVASVVAPPQMARPLRWRLGARSGTLAPGTSAPVEVPLPGRRVRDVAFTASPSGKLDDGRTVRGGITDVRAGRCGAL